MPNWCSNTLKVGGPAEDVFAFSKKAEKKEEGADNLPGGTIPLSFANFIPIPSILVAGRKKEFTMEDEEYNWRLGNWGVKWDLDVDTSVEEVDSNQIIYRFDTAWGPPVAFVRAVAKEHPRLCFRLEAIEPGMGFGFIGEYSEGEIENEVELNWNEVCEQWPDIAEYYGGENNEYE